jgi:hypothetical protein
MALINPEIPARGHLLGELYQLYDSVDSREHLFVELFAHPWDSPAAENEYFGSPFFRVDC